ncbi:Protein N-methyltransferase NNT1 [Trametes pubescens]|uniref:Protein N-methyltransferase NNT1 n=1 Tax=Trametes pubescens TaxID=154538 RepID=A0A1M2VZV9_TRAPU|nr:Protein N-methyltransferase NNT1 [Trametes pubescens]
MADMDDFLSDTAALYGDTVPLDDGMIRYGPLVLTVAPKEGKASALANTLLADHLFSPSLLLAEFIERGIISLSGKIIVELGAGCALPSLLSSTLSEPPSLVVITDYPDDTIMKNLTANVQRNRPHVNEKCVVHARGYEWGQDVAPLLDIASTHPSHSPDRGFDVVILSDLLHFDRSHDVLLHSLLALLRRAPSARAYVAAGTYTAPHVCAHFVSAAAEAGIVLEEGEVEPVWRGELGVSGGGLDREQLGVRKGMSRWWVGRWVDS